LKYQGCEKVPPRPRWAKFEVVSRGLLASLVTLLTNARIYIWNCNFHYNPDQPAAPAGTAVEAFLHLLVRKPAPTLSLEAKLWAILHIESCLFLTLLARMA
jgi:hypothetical protein